MIKNWKQMYIVIGAFILVLLLGTTTYAFFNYTRTGSSNTIKVGRISFTTNQTKTIDLSNVFPIDSSKVATDTENVGKVEITVVGDTDYTGGIEYLVSSEDSHVFLTRGNKTITVPISVNVDVTNLGTENSDYFNARESKNATIYKKLIGNTITGNQMLLVGYIKPNTTSGTIEGINGKVTITAYFDKDLISISDTYDGTESETNGTTTNWVDNRVTLTTSEWNSLQSNGISFKVKVEANEDIWVKGSLEEIMRKSAVMDNVNSTFVQNDTPGIDFGISSSDTNGKGVYMRAGTENDTNPIVYYRGDIDNNNVVFANRCWKAIRTTETGGVKLIYNGEYGNNYINGQNVPESVYTNVEHIDEMNSATNSGLVFDQSDKTWNVTLTDSSQYRVAFQVPSTGNYVIKITGTTRASSTTSITNYKNSEWQGSEQISNNENISYQYSHGQLNAGDNVSFILYYSAYNESSTVLKIWLEKDSTHLDENEYVNGIHGITFDSETNEWSSYQNRGDKSTIKFNVSEAGYYGIKYNLPGGSASHKDVVIKKGDVSYTLAYGENILNLGYVETSDQITVLFDNYNSEDYHNYRFALISQEVSGLGCNNTQYDTGIFVETNNEKKNAFAYSTATGYKVSPSYSGYMSGQIYESGNGYCRSGSYFGTGIEYVNGKYILTDAKVGYDGTHHYTMCGSTPETSYSVAYYFYETYNYIALRNGKKIEDVLSEMHENVSDSNAKTVIDNWYKDNLLSYTNKLEDTIWCNDKSVYNYGGWSPTGGSTDGSLRYTGGSELSLNKVTLTCSDYNSSFGVNIGNRKLNYPVALLTADEVKLAGNSDSPNFYLNNGVTFWLLTPSVYSGLSNPSNMYVSKGKNAGASNSWESSLRPTISLKQGQLIKSGTGTITDPYVIE